MPSRKVQCDETIKTRRGFTSTKLGTIETLTVFDRLFPQVAIVMLEYTWHAIGSHHLYCELILPCHVGPARSFESTIFDSENEMHLA